MKKNLRIILIIVSVIILIWAIYVLIDCIRLKKSSIYTYPIIKISETYNVNNTVKYTGIGYTVSYTAEKEQKVSLPDSVAIGYGKITAEFRIFGKILVWSYEYNR